MLIASIKNWLDDRCFIYECETKLLSTFNGPIDVLIINGRTIFVYTQSVDFVRPDNPIAFPAPPGTGRWKEYKTLHAADPKFFEKFERELKITSRIAAWCRRIF